MVKSVVKSVVKGVVKECGVYLQSLSNHKVLRGSVRHCAALCGTVRNCVETNAVAHGAWC